MNHFHIEEFNLFLTFYEQYGGIIEYKLDSDIQLFKRFFEIRKDDWSVVLDGETKEKSINHIL